ncbi:MAG: cysteine sulfinate desulfinase [Gammaproteobacteria bacterium RIFCSPLOWO2_02_FULL_52_10]|nr:MAG: cysteine sulfinate desulfinase [Gammaproteobacteria bacterium RIFCSPLOWO2_02_FULL_52_10]OGT85390.1 MAG: cysteine sulfinate desulfinase [Gammaproteobacteria bacterium RIFCSPLOWO2_12_FULL_52_10]
MTSKGTAARYQADPPAFDVEAIRADFPILSRRVHGKPLVYLDNAATTQKPVQVIEAIDHYYRHYNANIHRGVHTLSAEATAAYEAARQKVRDFLNAGSDKEIIFVRGATEAINLVAQTLGRGTLKAGDEIIISTMEHHSNIVPWQILCEQTGAVLKVIPINDKGELIMEAYEKLLNERTRIVSIVHISNALGTIVPVTSVIEKARRHGALVLLDGAQAVSHTVCDVRALDCDFYVFSSHKLFGPTGVGVLYGKQQLLEKMPPYQGGGDMIKTVTFARTEYNDLPYKFEAGTPDIAGVIGLGAAVDYVNKIGLAAIAGHERDLLAYGTAALQEIQGLRLIGTARDKASILSFVLDGIHPHDIGTILDHAGVAIRTGHHCAMPVMDFFRVPATARASLAFYNTRAEIDILVRAVHSARKIFAK